MKRLVTILAVAACSASLASATFGWAGSDKFVDNDRVRPPAYVETETHGSADGLTPIAQPYRAGPEWNAPVALPYQDISPCDGAFICLPEFVQSLL